MGGKNRAVGVKEGNQKKNNMEGLETARNGEERERETGRDEK